MNTRQPNRHNNRIPSCFILVLTVVVVVGLVVFYMIFPPERPLPPGISWGQTILVRDDNQSAFNQLKKNGTQSFRNKKFDEAAKIFQQARDNIKFCEKRDPELLIYRNNALLQSQSHYTIAVVVPITNRPDEALEILRGVAQAQQEINQAAGTLSLKVVIADDKNNANEARRIAKELVKMPDVLGVVGHFSSDTTKAAMEEYDNQKLKEEEKLVLISPTATAVKSQNTFPVTSPYFFRTVPDNRVQATALANYMQNSLNNYRNVVIFYEEGNLYSLSLRDEFAKAIERIGVKIVNKNNGVYDTDFDLSKNITLNNTLNKANNAEVFMFAISSQRRNIAIQVIKKPESQRKWHLGGDGMYAEETLSKGKVQVRNMVFAVPWHRYIKDKEGRAENFIKSSNQLWCEPKDKVTWRTVTAMDATNALEVALSGAGQNPTRIEVQKKLSSDNILFQGVSDAFKFKSGDRVKINGDPGTQLVQIQCCDNQPCEYREKPTAKELTCQK